MKTTTAEKLIQKHEDDYGLYEACCVDKDQDWKNGITYYIFKDGSVIKQDGPMSEVGGAR